MLRDVGRPADARSSYGRAITLSEKLLAESPSSPEYVRTLAASLDCLAQLGGFSNASSETEQLYRRAIELEEKLVAGSPSVPAYRRRLAGSMNNLGLHFLDRDPPQAEKLFRQAIAIADKLSADFPPAVEYLRTSAMARNNLGYLLEQMGRPAAAEQEYRSLVAMAEKQATDLTSAPVFQRELASSYVRLADLSLLAGRRIEAEDASRRAIAVLEKLLDHESRNTLAWILATSPFPQLRDSQQAVKLAKQAVEQRPQHGEFWTTLGVAHYRAGEFKGAIEALEKSMQLSVGEDASRWFFLAMACWQSGDKGKARSWYDKAVLWIEKNKSQDDKLRRFRAEAASVLAVTEHPKSAYKKEEDTLERSKP